MNWALALMFFWCGSVFATVSFAAIGKLTCKPHYLVFDIVFIAFLAWIGFPS